MSDTEKQQQDLAEDAAMAEVEDLEISKEEADAVSGGTVSSQTSSGKRFGA